MMDIVERCSNYLSTGGLFNPELADHNAVRDLVINCRDEIERLRWENANMEKLWGKSEGTWMEIRDNQNAEIERLREALEKVLSVQPIKGDEGSTDIIALAKALLEIDSTARAALKEKE